MVNLGINQSAAQQWAVAVTEGASAQVDLFADKDDSKRTEEKSMAKRALDTKGAKDVSKEVLTNLVNGLSESGMKLDAQTLNAKIRGNAKDEYDLLCKSEEEGSDSVNISNLKNAIKAAKRASNKKGGGGNSRGEAGDPAKLRGTVDQYTAATIQFLLNGGTEQNKKMKLLEAKLRAQGMSHSDILKLTKGIKDNIRGAIAAQIKEAVIKKMLSKNNSLDWMMSSKELFKAFGSGQNNAKLGGWDFGGYNKHLQGTYNKQALEARGELRSFVKEELERNLVSKHLGSDSADKDIKELFDLGKKIGFSFKSFSKNWVKKMDDVGFTPLPGDLPNMQSQMQNNSNNKPQDYDGYDYNKDDEKELLINQLRALYMQRAIKGNMLASLETAIKIKRNKQGLLKLGIKFGDFDEIEKEGQAVARLRVTEMLREALYERATLYELAGPAFKLNGKKIKGLMKNLARLGIELTPGEFKALRDDANRSMFNTAKDELQKVMIMRKTNRSPSLEKKEMLLIKLLERLQEETGIVADLLPIISTFEIKEAA
jgi:hypothetical protein